MTKIHYFIMLTFLLITGACSTDSNEPEGRTYDQLTFSDEFEGEGAIDGDKWIFDLGTGAEIGLPGWGNQELQYYTDRLENIKVEDGMLHITARKEDFRGSQYTSARILTKGTFEQTFGRFEASIKLPEGRGIWPAFWLLGDDSNGSVIWPEIGEIDIMEYRGQEPDVIHGSIHGPGYSAGQAVTDSYRLVNDRFDNDFYVFAVEWGPDFIDFFVNDIKYNTITPADANGRWVFNDNTFYIILNIAVGGTFVGPPSDISTEFPQTMLVDYVRVYSE
jgi:beta-glucanase (GH16 family)